MKTYFLLDISRFEKFHSEIKFITERVTETLGDLYAMHWPYKQHITSRNQKLLPYHNDLKEASACFGIGGGFERPMWYALNATLNQNINIVLVIKIGMNLQNMKLFMLENMLLFLN